MAIISHTFGFIFCKTQKTAGTSLEVHLARRCSPTDIVTRIYPANPEHEPRNYQGRLFQSHMSMVEIREILGERIDKYFSFCVERHPIEKCISHYAMKTQSPAHRSPSSPRSWDEYVLRRKFPMDYDKYATADGQVLVDKIYRYEELDSMMAELSSRFGWPNEPLDVREKSGFRSHAPTVDEVTERQRQIIFEAFQPSLSIVPY